MKCKILFLAVSLLVATALPTAAQVNVDMNKFTCGDWLALSQEQQGFVRFWMSGYYNAAANSNMLDYSRMQRNSAKVANYCRRHKSDTLPTAIQKSAS